MLVQFTLPLPPSVNNQYVTVGNRRMLSREAQAYKRAAKRQIEQLQRRDVIPPAFVAQAAAGYLALFLDFYFETPLRRDLDGGLKIAQDIICTTLGLNDNRVVDIHLVKRIDPLHPRLVVEMEALSDWQFEDERLVLK
ncbi:MAG TPA: RusA family crossover junction endodeoxyribonuclease [Herpetosiphonaceae bacterium]|nr:RusA family crossover junction endodeoxyribonuclease [Herpetosiphonaceae bacterium]